MLFIYKGYDSRNGSGWIFGSEMSRDVIAIDIDLEYTNHKRW